MFFLLFCLVFRLTVVRYFGYYGPIYDFDLIVNCDKLISDQRRLIVRYLRVASTTEVPELELEYLYLYLLLE